MTVRLAKILLAAAVALWGSLSAVHNLADWPGTVQAVAVTTSMALVEGSSGWQAMDSTALAWAGALFLLAGKLAAALLCGHGSLRMWHRRRAAPAAFQTAKQPALAGCMVAVATLFIGFAVFAETWFELWRVPAMHGPVLESAFRYGAMIAAAGLLIGQADSDLPGPGP